MIKLNKFDLKIGNSNTNAAFFAFDLSKISLEYTLN